MAIFPCDAGRHPYPGRGGLIYASVASSLGDRRSRAHVCERHWREVEPRLSESELAEDGTFAYDLDGPTTCLSCLKPLDERGAQVFVTSYPAKDDRKDYWFRIHEGCPTPTWLPWKAQAENS